MFRIVLAMVLGNVLGFGAWRAAVSLLPALWSAVEAGAGPGARLGFLALTAVTLAAPPVLIGALAAWLARRAYLWVGLACGLWAFTLVNLVPVEFPIAAGVWYAPTVLILLSGALGGWMLDLRRQVRPD